MKLMIISILGIFLALPFASAGDRPAVGTEAPDFTLLDTDGQIHTLSKYRDKVVVLYFYPRDITPGCTKEACNLRDNYDALTEKGIKIFGISYDNAESHKKFRDEHNLPFTLLSDTKKEVSKLYDVKGMIGAKRVTFIIGTDGKIIHVFDKVKTGEHAAQILEVLEKQAKPKSE